MGATTTIEVSDLEIILIQLTRTLLAAIVFFFSTNANLICRRCARRRRSDIIGRAVRVGLAATTSCFGAIVQSEECQHDNDAKEEENEDAESG